MMPWIYLLLSAGAMVLAFRTSSFGLMAAALLAALGLLVAFALSFLAQRIGSRSRDESVMLDPVELRRLREQADARRAAAAAGAASEIRPGEPPAP
jgi:hypothetical protein